MRPSNMTREERLHVGIIASKMESSGIPKELLEKYVEIASEFEGVYDLFKMWEEEVDQEEAKLILNDIDDLVRECGEAIETHKEKFNS